MQASRSFGGRITALLALIALTLSPAVADDLAAQQDLSGDLAILRENHPDLARLVEAVDVVNHTIFETIVEGGSDQETFDRLVRDILANPRWDASMASAEMGPGLGGAVPARVMEAMERANAFHHELLDVYADPAALTGAFRDVQRLVQTYSSNPEVSFLLDPKDVMMTTDGEQAGAFRTAYPNLHGLLWANRWLQLAAFEPLVRYETLGERTAGVAAVMARYWFILSDPPESFPTEAPMAPTIAPTLVAYHPQAAAVLDNAFMYHDLAADAFVSQSVQDEERWLDQLLADFQDPEYRWTSWYDWNRMAILHGVGNQGGWATGIIPDPKQTQLQLNRDHHDMEGHIVIPGMPGPGM